MCLGNLENDNIWIKKEPANVLCMSLIISHMHDPLANVCVIVFIISYLLIINTR